MRDEEIRSALKRMASDFGPDNSVLAQVKAGTVDEENMVCDLYDDEAGNDYFDVRLRPVLDGNESLTILPADDSWVLAARIEGSEDWMAIAFGEIDKWRLKIGESVVEATSAGLLIQKQDDTLKQVLQLLIEAVQVIVVVQGTNPDYTKLTEAMNKLNNLLR
jgi:hypothetical protein